MEIRDVGVHVLDRLVVMAMRVTADELVWMVVVVVFAKRHGASIIV